MPSIADILERDCVVRIESTIPEDMTIAEWRRMRNAQPANRRRKRRSRSAVPTATSRSVTVPSALRVGRSS